MTAGKFPGAHSGLFIGSSARAAFFLYKIAFAGGLKKNEKPLVK